DFEFGKNVSFDSHRLGRLLIAQKGPDMVVAHVDFIGELKINRSDSEVRGFLRALEYFVAFGVLDFKGEIFSSRRMKVKRLERQCANVNELSRLIKRLVADQQYLGIGFD